MRSQIVLIVVLSFVRLAAIAQTNQQKNWQVAGDASLKLNQVHFSNWVSGGHSSLSLLGCLDYSANYQKGKIAWINQFTDHIGVAKLGKGSSFKKTSDFLELNTRISFAHKKRTHFVAFGNLISQVANGYDEESQINTHTSSFFAPAYLTEGIGYEFRSLNFSADSLFFAVFSPLAAKHTMVYDKNVDGTRFGLSTKNGTRNEFGGYLQVGFKKRILERTKLSTQLQMYTNYESNFGNIDVNWRTQLAVNANKWISMFLITQLVYDDDSNLPSFADLNADGLKEVTAVGPKLQFMEVLGIGITLKL